MDLGRSSLARFSGLLLGVVATLSATEARAEFCDVNTTPMNCWRDHTTANASTVVVGPGIACSTDSPQPTSFNFHLSCHVPNGPVMVKGAGEIDNQSTYFLNTDAYRMRSVAIQGSANGAVGPTQIWVLRNDGELFVSAGDPRVYRSFTPFVWVGSPWDINKNPLKFRQITVVQPPYGGAFVLAVSTQNRIYGFVQNSTRTTSYWNRLSTTDYYAAYGGPYGLLALNGTRADPATYSLSMLYRLTTNTVPTFTQPLPSWSYDRAPKEFYMLGATEPFSLGIADAWRIYSRNSIYRAQLNAQGNWSTWGFATALAGNISSGDAYSIVDARAFRGQRGETMVIGGPQHLYSFFSTVN
jgi:hypothetical protein